MAMILFIMVIMILVLRFQRNVVLVVPVLRDADKMSMAEIEAKIAEYAEKARAGKLTLEEMQGGTFTITNGGVFGSLMSTPIIKFATKRNFRHA